MAEITKDTSQYIPDHLEKLHIDTGGLRGRDALLMKTAAFARRILSLRRIKRTLVKNARHVRRKLGKKDHVVSDARLNHNRVNSEVAANDARHHHLAYCFLKGTAYKRAERECYTNPDFEKILEIARDYTHLPYYMIHQQYAEWMQSAVTGEKISKNNKDNKGKDISATFKPAKSYMIPRKEAKKQRKAFPPKKRTLADWQAEMLKKAEILERAKKIKSEQSRGSAVVSMTDRVKVNKLTIIVSQDKENGLWFAYATQIPSICAMGTDRDQTVLKFELMCKAAESAIEQKRAALP